MRRIAILGGTAWLGREIAREAQRTGAEVVCLARGESGAVPEGVRLLSVDRRGPDAYAALTGDWDEVIELSYDLGFVTGALEALADRAAHWTLVSSVSVYADNTRPHADEGATLVEPQDLSSYPDAKVAAERATLQRIRDRALLARPGLIVGPGDPTDRFGYWPARLLRSGRVLTPEPDGLHVQVIDVADLATWILHAGSAGQTGPVNAVGEVHTFAELLQTAAATLGFEGEFVPMTDDDLSAAGIAYWAGPRSLPLWLPRADAGFAQRDPRTYAATGGRVRPLSETIARVAADERVRGLDRPRRSGLTLAEEREVLSSGRR